MRITLNWRFSANYTLSTQPSRNKCSTSPLCWPKKNLSRICQATAGTAAVHDCFICSSATHVSQRRWSLFACLPHHHPVNSSPDHLSRYSIILYIHTASLLLPSALVSSYMCSDETKRSNSSLLAILRLISKMKKYNLVYCFIKLELVQKIQIQSLVILDLN